MKQMTKTATLLALFTTAGALSAATVITNQDIPTNDSDPLPGHPNYGSRVSSTNGNWDASTGAWEIYGTPNITLIWDGEGGGHSGTGLDPYRKWEEHGLPKDTNHVIQLDGGQSGGTPNTYISFVPDAGVTVYIGSFILDEWSGGGGITVEWSIFADSKSGNLLKSGTWTGDNAGFRSQVSVDHLGDEGQTLVLKLERTSGLNNYLALDDLSFDQKGVPEPATAVLAGLGLLAMGRRRRN